MITTLAVITSIRPVFLVGFGLLSIVYYKNALVYSKSARELRRLDSVSKSPLYSIYEEAITGIAVIRAFGASSRFMRLFRSRCENNITFYWCVSPGASVESMNSMSDPLLTLQVPMVCQPMVIDQIRALVFARRRTYWIDACLGSNRCCPRWIRSVVFTEYHHR